MFNFIFGNKQDTIVVDDGGVVCDTTFDLDDIPRSLEANYLSQKYTGNIHIGHETYVFIDGNLISEEN